MVSLQAYIDDSRSDAGERRFVLAGYINTADNWMAFSDKWLSELKRTPSIEYLKMKEAFGLNGQFGGWQPEERDRKVQSLAAIIRQFQPASIHSSVSQNLVNEIVKPVAPYGLSSAYFYCFQAIMIPLAMHQSKQFGSGLAPIDFIFDQQEGLGEESRAIYQAIRDGLPDPIKQVLSLEPIFCNDKLVMPIQAADMLAWHIRRHYERGDPSAFMVPNFLSGDGSHAAIDFDEPTLRRIADGFAKIPDSEAWTKKSAWKKQRRDMKRLGLTFTPVDKDGE